MNNQESLGVPIPRVIRSFKDEQELRKVTRSLHNLIWAEGHDDAKSFDELTKVLFLKLYDERENSDHYEFKILQGEKPKDTAKRIRTLFEELAKSPKYGQAFHSSLLCKNSLTDLKSHCKRSSSVSASRPIQAPIGSFSSQTN